MYRKVKLTRNSPVVIMGGTSVTSYALELAGYSLVGYEEYEYRHSFESWVGSRLTLEYRLDQRLRSLVNLGV